MPLNITLCAINSQDTGCLARQCDQIETCRRAVLHCEDRALMVSHIIVATDTHICHIVPFAKQHIDPQMKYRSSLLSLATHICYLCQIQLGRKIGTALFMGTAIQTMGGSSFRLVGVYKMSKAAVRHYRDTFFIHNITDDIQIMTGFRQNHRTGHLFVSKHAPNKRMGKMPVSHIFCQLKIKNVSNGSIFHQFFYFFKKRSVTQHMAHCKNKVFPFRSLHHFRCIRFHWEKSAFRSGCGSRVQLPSL